MASTIGIKLANGEFYSILEENSDVKRRLILTTVHDSQRSMQIDLYKSFTRSMADALYIGSIVVEDIKPRPKGEPSVEMIIASNAGGEITADAIDLDSSSHADHQYLSVSLKSINEDNREPELPDFELDSHEPPPRGLYEKAVSVKEKQDRHGFPWAALIVTGILLILAGLCLWFFVFRGQGEKPAGEPAATVPTVQPPTAPEPPAPEPPVLEQPVPEPPVPEPPAIPVPLEEPPPDEPPRSEVPIIEAPAVPPPEETPPKEREPVLRRSGRNPPVASFNVPATIPREGYPYRIRWGDTLWDISEAFYRNPWLYPRIARFNSIRNPDFIISGRTIRIPPRN
ncbi:MAG: LysM peptidoglycan-binding domain-containing protein [Treponema sp.]|nr:LysM peptidoglycan-binding domain-containing protein [Treponema sp.]